MDDKLIVGWNGLMIGALATSGRILNRGADIQAAQRAANRILEHPGPSTALHRYLRGGTPHGSALLQDYAYLAEGLLDLHAACGDGRWLEEARALVDAALVRFWDGSRGGFFETDERHAPLRERLKPVLDRDLPSSNGVMASVLFRLQGSDRRYLELARRTLAAFETGKMGHCPIGAETLAAAALFPGAHPDESVPNDTP